MTDAPPSETQPLGFTTSEPAGTDAADAASQPANSAASGTVSAFSLLKEPSLPSGRSLAMKRLKKAGTKVQVQVQVTSAFSSSKIFEALAENAQPKNPLLKCLYKIWKFTIHPHNKFHTVWDLFILLLVFYSSIAEPFKVAFNYTEQPGLDEGGMTWYEICIDLSFYLDIIINFWTGVDRGYDVDFDKKAIAKEYLALWFWIDFLATVEWDLIVKAINPEIDAGTVSLVRLIKVARLARASRLINRLTASWTINTGFIDATKFLVYVLICAHWLACFFFFIPNLLDAFDGSWLIGNSLVVLNSCNEGTLECEVSDACLEEGSPLKCYQNAPEGIGTVDQYVKSMYWSLTTMTTIGYGDIGPTTQVEIVYVLFAMIIGLAFFAVLLEQINKLYTVLGKQEQAAADTKNDVVSFLKANSIDQDIIQRTITYLNFRANTTSGSVFDEDDERFSNLSPALKRKIHVAIFYNALMKIKMFGYHDEVVAEIKTVKNYFEETDVDGGGSLDEEEIAALVENLGMKMTPEAVKVAVAEMEGGVDGLEDGEAGDGQIKIDEFDDWWFRTKYQCPRIAPPPKSEETANCMFIEELAHRGRSTLSSPQDVMFGAGEYKNALRVVLSGVVKIRVAVPEHRKGENSVLAEDDEDAILKITYEDREPAFGFAAAISYEAQQRIVSPLDTWEVVATWYSDVLSLDANQLEEAFDHCWKEGPAEFLKLAKSRYKFDYTIVVKEKPKVHLPVDQQLAAFEEKVTQQISEMDAVFESTLGKILSKLDTVVSQNTAFAGLA